MGLTDEEVDVMTTTEFLAHYGLSRDDILDKMKIKEIR